MNHTKGHGSHMWVVGAIGAGALLMGSGLSAAIAVALIACAAMLGAIFWLMRRPQVTPQTEPSRYEDLNQR